MATLCAIKTTRLQKNVFNLHSNSLFIVGYIYTVRDISPFTAAVPQKTERFNTMNTMPRTVLKLNPSYPTSASSCQSSRQIEYLAGRF